MTQRWQPGTRNNFFVLFAALLLLAIVGPVLGVALGDVGFYVTEGSLVFALIGALWGIRLSRVVRRIGIGLVVINAVLSIVGLVEDNLPARVMADVTAVLFLGICALVASYDVFRRERVNLNKVIGGLCIYVLIGVIWAFLYRLLEQSAPGSFVGLAEVAGGDLRWSMLYFSFVTLTTLGYGDISPVNVFAQTLVSLQAVLGQFFLAVLVAGLVGGYLNTREQTNAEE